MPDRSDRLSGTQPIGSEPCPTNTANLSGTNWPPTTRTPPDSGQPGVDYRILHAPDEDTGEWRPIGGVMPLSEEMKQCGARPIWLGYIGVDDVDQTVARVTAPGGSVQMPARDIPGVGRLAMVTDP